MFTGDVSGAGGYGGNIEFRSGFSPGNSTAHVVFADDLRFIDASVLKVELAGHGTGMPHDKVTVEGRLDAAGTLAVVLVEGFEPGLGDTFDLLDANEMAGKFETMLLPNLRTGLVWDSSLLQGQGLLTVVPTPGSAAVLWGGLLVAIGRRHQRPCK